MNEKFDTNAQANALRTYHDLMKSDDWVTFEEAQGILNLKKRAIQYKIKEFNWEKRQPLYNGRQVTFLLKSQLYDYIKNSRNNNVSLDYAKEAGEVKFTTHPTIKNELSKEEKIALQIAANKDLTPFLDGYNNLFRQYNDLNEKRLSTQQTIAEKDTEILKREKRIVAYKFSLIFIVLILAIIGSYFGYKNYQLTNDIENFDDKIKTKDLTITELQTKAENLKDTIVANQNKHTQEYTKLYEKLNDIAETKREEGVKPFSIYDYKFHNDQ